MISTEFPRCACFDVFVLQERGAPAQTALMLVSPLCCCMLGGGILEMRARLWGICMKLEFKYAQLISSIQGDSWRFDLNEYLLLTD